MEKKFAKLIFMKRKIFNSYNYYNEIIRDIIF